ncbi:MAG: tRNA pseudouridine(55) synthase TruB [Hyphomicrobiales bacterium]|nr:tRNA pseudouridine(55) synthase TruB [Hyphomicrobiales bacterium]
MARRKRGRPVNGWLVLDKPAGMTSTQAVGAVRRAFDAQKAGHAGTLDPLATGILPIALGEATKTVPFTVDSDKVYRFTIRWGAETTTDDTEGAVTRDSAARPTAEDIEALLPRFTGEIMQVPPQFSAIKVDGERAYDMARAGEVVDLEARPVFIEELTILGSPSPDETMLEAVCGRGTYVRSIARDLGRLLGCYGHVSMLRRTRVGDFDEECAVTIEALRAAAESGDPAQLAQFLQPIATALGDLFELAVSSADAARLARGQSVLIRGRDAPILSGPAFATCKGELVALGEIDKGELRPSRVFTFG